MKVVTKTTNYAGAPAHHAPSRAKSVPAILKQVDADIHKVYSVEAVKFYINSNILSYFTSDESDNLESFKQLIKGIKDILSKSYDVKTADQIFTDSMKYTFKFAKDHEFTDQQHFLEDSRYTVQDEHKVQEHKAPLGDISDFSDY